MIGWLLYSMLVAALLALAAAALEAGLRLRGRPTRWVWALALAGSIAIPLAERYAPSFSAIPRVEISMAVPLVGQPAVAQAGASAPAETSTMSAADLVLAGWIGGSAVLLTLLGVNAFRLRRARGGWVRRRVEDVPVWVSDHVGPAVLGIIRPEIVVPDWALALPAPLRHLMLLHEREHLRAGDSNLLLSSLLAVALAPWNVFMWWQLHRLRQAVELDCDDRVLARSAGDSASVADYGELLLTVGRRRSRIAPVALGAAGMRSGLERRLRELCRPRRSGSVRKVASLAALGIALASLAVCSPDMTMPEGATPEAAPAVADGEPIEGEEPAEEVDAEEKSDEVAGEERREEVPARGVRPADEGEMLGLPVIPGYPSDLTDAPVFTPREVDPTLVNRQDVQDALEVNYPTVLRDAGIGGTVTTYLFIDQEGNVLRALVHESSGSPVLDEAALSVVDVMEYEPAINRGEAVPVWVQINITFSAM